MSSFWQSSSQLGDLLWVDRVFFSCAAVYFKSLDNDLLYTVLTKTLDEGKKPPLPGSCSLNRPWSSVSPASNLALLLSCLWRVPVRLLLPLLRPIFSHSLSAILPSWLAPGFKRSDCTGEEWCLGSVSKQVLASAKPFIWKLVLFIFNQNLRVNKTNFR